MFKNKQKINEFIQITIGVICVSLGFYFFFSPANLVTGGVSGLSIIFRQIFSASETAVSIFILVANLLLLLVGGLVLGKEYFLKTVYGTIMLPLLIYLYSLVTPSDFNLLSSVTDDTSRLLISAVSGAVLTGFGLGLVFKNNATTGGTDVLQKILNTKAKLPYSITIYLTDGLAILAGLLIFKVEATFYAILALSIVGFVVDRVVLSGRTGYTVFIVTNDYQLLKDAIYAKVNRGVTKVQVVGGYSEVDRDMIICTISRSQLYNLKSIVAEIDPLAFTFITKTTESVGQGFN